MRFGAVVLVAGCLYWAQAIFIPVALAILITFLLAPLVSALQRWHVPRGLAVIVVVVFALAVVGGVGTVLATQLMSLGEELPRYKDNIKEKIADVRGLRRQSGLEGVRETVTKAAGEAEREASGASRSAKAADAKAAPAPTPVVIQEDRATQLRNLPSRLAPWVDPLSRAGFVILLVPFMLLGREELRNRILRLIGFGRLAVTTRAMDEASSRVTRYLLTQTIINTTFGLLAAGGLFLIGVPYALLFGLMAGALRFVPYVGIWIGAGLPIVTCLAAFPGWSKALLVIGLFAVLELLVSAVLEPLLYARSAGVSEVGLLVAIAFWTWAWGAIGLLLATPITVCLVVIAKHVPELEFIWVLMGDEPSVSTDIAVYQRLLADDDDEASDIVERYVAQHPGESVYDEVLRPCLALAARDHAAGRIDADEHRMVVDGVRDIVDNLEPPAAGVEFPERVHVLGGAARGEADEAALVMLRHALAPMGVTVDVMSSELLSAELVGAARGHAVPIVVIGALPPGGLARARYFCKRLRAGVPDVKIIVCRWGAADGAETAREPLLAAGADAVGATLLETRDLIVQAARTLPARVPERAA